MSKLEDLDGGEDAKALKAYRAAHVALYNEQPLKLGLFSINSNGNVFFSDLPDIPTRRAVSWENSVNVARLADEIGFEAFIPVARWRGFGGSTNWAGDVYETLTYAAGIAASTKNIMTFATVHAPLVHPVAAAKAITTIDHISGGRAGLNVVMGWYEKEMRMMGTELRAHDDRYGYGAEWTELIERLWSDAGSFDYHGKYFDLEAAEASPKPIQPRPVLLNAGASPAGLDFAARYADFNFASFVSADQASAYASDMREKAAGYGREIGLVTLVIVVCRDTEAEAQAAYQAIIDHGDWDAAENFMKDLNISSTFKEHMKKEFLSKFVAGSGGYALVGTPEQVAEGFQTVRASGIDCALLGMIDYEQELRYFNAKVMPLLKQNGVRV
jgi:FMNH2-dependent dimethyl sulfone monooxygenase